MDNRSINFQQDMDRVRDIMTGPDGFLYVALELPGPDTPDHVVRIVPADCGLEVCTES